MDGRVRKRLEEKLRVRLSEARDNRVWEQHMGWGDGTDVDAPLETDEDCEGCDDDE